MKESKRRWIAAAAAFSMGAFTWGSLLSFGVFVPTLSEEFQKGRGTTAWVVSLASAAGALCNAVSGPLADKIEIRTLGFIGAIFHFAGWMMSSFMQSFHFLFIIFILCGLGASFSVMPSIASVGFFFANDAKNASVAFAIAACGAAFGNFILPQAFRPLLEALGWRWTFRIVSCFSLILILNAFALQPTGDAHTMSKASKKKPLKDLIIQRNFKLLFVVVGISYIGFYVPFAHIVSYALDIGISSDETPIILSTIGAVGVAARIATGFSVNYLGKMAMFRTMYFLMGTTCLLWTLARNLPSVLLFAASFGGCAGSFVALVPVVAKEYFGPEYAGTAPGLLFSGACIGYVTGSPLVGYLFDIYHTYLPGSLFVAICYYIAFILLFFVTKPNIDPKRPQFHQVDSSTQLKTIENSQEINNENEVAMEELQVGNGVLGALEGEQEPAIVVLEDEKVKE